jgi:hypothetical protein
MEKKQIQFKTKGMNRDLSVSAFNPQYSFENMNLRLSTNDGNTTLSWVNEKGTLPLAVLLMDEQQSVFSLRGTAIGNAVINHCIILFTTETGEDRPDHIYKLWYKDEEQKLLIGTELFNGRLNFNVQYPIETLTYYESSEIVKVYWTDGYNQPRLINIMDVDGIKRRMKLHEDYPIDTQFDFVPAVDMQDSSFKVVKNSIGGSFTPGVIQYCYTYFNKHGQQTNIIDTSSLYYLTHDDRGAKPDDTVSCSFTIHIDNIDPSYDSIRLYSIQRSAINGTPYARQVADISISEDDTAVSYVDTGASGSVIDARELIYIGGKDITAYTMADKDNTLFLGNISQKNVLLNSLKEYYKENNAIIEFHNDGKKKRLSLDHPYGVYANTNSLRDNNQHDITTFKGGEFYRFGFQLQKNTGEWLEPVFIKDARNPLYPSTSIGNINDTVDLVYATSTLNLEEIAKNFNNDNPGNDFFEVFTRIRPVIVFPTILNRAVVCQGVLNPTVFNIEDRKDNSPYAQASWFFRPYVWENGHDNNVVIDNQDNNLVKYSSAMETSLGNNTPSSQLTDTKSIYVKKFYLMVATVPNDEIPSMLNSGHIIGNYGGQNNSFYAVVYLWQRNGYSRMIFFKEEIHSIGYENPWNISLDNKAFWGNLKDIETSDNAYVNLDLNIFKPNSQKGSFNNRILLYYTDTIKPYVINIPIGNRRYIITLNPVGSNGNIVINSVDYGGSPLEFRHYKSLHSTSDLEDLVSNGEEYNRMAKTIEVQGSVNTYKSMFQGGKTLEKSSSNTQFAVDQSIVTLNSPDIDFDKEVQTSSLEGLALRIVGAIPITSCVSSETITASSSLLPAKLDGDNVPDAENATYGIGDSGKKIAYPSISLKAGERLVASALWNDVLIKWDKNNVTTSNLPVNFMVYPWQRTGSLNNDSRDASKASSLLEKKKESTLLYSIATRFLNEESFVNFGSIDTQLHLTENEQVVNMRLNKQTADEPDINYYPNIDKALVNSKGYDLIYTPYSANNGFPSKNIVSPVSMKYKSTAHAVIALDAEDEYVNDKPKSSIPILPYGLYNDTGNIGKYENDENEDTPYTIWGTVKPRFTQKCICLNNLFEHNYNFLWIGELYRKESNDEDKYKETIFNNHDSDIWYIGGDAVGIWDGMDSVELIWTNGDTYYQRYDCMKTYPFTREDPNQIVEILSFMCETRINLDGRYDRNRGQMDNTNMSPENFNLINDAYTQKDNFLNYSQLDTKGIRSLTYGNQICYSLTKSSEADIDEYSHLTLASVLEMDGNKGHVNAIRRLDNNLIAFQDSGIAQILYNENTALSTQDGIPVEIGNSGKVQGKRYISDTIGCQNKYSMASTPLGIYFMDSISKDIYLFNGQLRNLSSEQGFNSWTKESIPNAKYLEGRDIWNPMDFDNFITHYDRMNQDLLFTGNNCCLAYSEKLGTFTSFYSYEGTPYLINLDNTGIWVRNGNGICTLHKHNAGRYCEFFGKAMPYWMTLIGNPEPEKDKVFTNIELRASMDDDGILPFDSIEVWNEYQHGIASLSNSNGHRAMLHHALDNTSSLKRRFRIWRCDVPRDNAPLESDSLRGVSRISRHPLDRMRNPWVYMRMQKDSNESFNKTEIHDIAMTYYI